MVRYASLYVYEEKEIILVANIKLDLASLVEKPHFIQNLNEETLGAGIKII